MKILITGGKSAPALKLIRKFPNDTIVLADYGEMPNFSSGNYRFISLGTRNNDVLAHNLLTFCLDEAADVIIPLDTMEFEELQKSKVLFEEFNISIINSADFH